jgi:hypothetical protein
MKGIAIGLVSVISFVALSQLDVNPFKNQKVGASSMGMVVPVNVSDPNSYTIVNSGYYNSAVSSDEESEKPANKSEEVKISKEQAALEQKLEAEKNKLADLEDQMELQQVVVKQLEEKISGLPTSEYSPEDHKVDINEKVEDLSHRLTILESKVRNGER